MGGRGVESIVIVHSLSNGSAATLSVRISLSEMHLLLTPGVACGPGE